MHTSARHRNFASSAAAVALVLCGAVAGAPTASADVVQEIGISCYTTVTNASETFFYGFQVGDTIKFVDNSVGANGGCRWKGNNTDGPVTPSSTSSPGPWLFTPNQGSGSWIYFTNTNGVSNWTAQFEVLPPTPAGTAESSAAPVNYTVILDPEDAGTCSMTSVSGPAGSWQRLPQESACTKPGYRFVGWEARHTDGQPTTRYPAYSYINLTGDNTLYAVWEPVSVAKVEPAKATRWVVWQWDAKTKQTRPVSADLIDLRPVVTIHSPEKSAVSAAMVKAAEQLAARHGGTYAGIVTATTWKKPRIVTAYVR